MADNGLRHHPHAAQGTLLTDKVLHRVKLVQYHDPFLRGEIPGLAASWLSDDEAFSHFGGMTVVLQNHSVYRTAVSESGEIGALYSAAPGGNHIGSPIWFPSQT
jgi:hypothetical protein